MTCRPVLLLVALAALLAGPIAGPQAQITITAQDARDALAPGVYGQQFMTAEPGETARIQTIIDQIGPGGTYDFSAVEVSTVSFDVGEVQARPFDASVPADADFDDADFVDVSDPFGDDPLYTFFGIEDDGYYEYGDLSSPFSVTSKTTYTPPLRAFPLPLTETTTWGSGDVTESFYTNAALDSTREVSYSGDVIGYGTLILPGGRTLPTLVHRLVQVEGGETTTALSFVTKGQRDAVTVLTDGNRMVAEFPTGTGTTVPAAFFFLKSEAAAEAAIARNTTGLFLGGALGATVELTSGSSTDGQLRGYRLDFPSFNNAGFEVQRRFDGAPFATVGFVEDAGTNDEGRRYRFTDRTVPFAADSLTYRLRQVDLDGTAHLHAPVILRRGVPDRLAVRAPYPNPTTGTVTLRYTLPAAGPVRIAVYNVLGQEVAVLVQGEERAGRVERLLDLSRLPSGAYFVRLTAAGQDRTERLTVVR